MAKVTARARDQVAPTASAGAIRQRRHRRHKVGDHLYCQPAHCGAAGRDLSIAVVFKCHDCCVVLQPQASGRAPSRCAECAERRRQSRKAQRKPVQLKQVKPTAMFAPCRDCGELVSIRPDGMQPSRCYACGEPRKKRSALCAGPCGKMITGGSSSLPAGQRMCQPCRRLSPKKKPAADPRQPIACATCCDLFIPRHSRAKYCQPLCFKIARLAIHRIPTERDRERWRKRPSWPSRYGRGWPAARLAVLDEETHCGFCGDEVDKTLTFPHRLSPSVDHIVRREHGGTHDRSNLRLAHLTCNAAGRARWAQGYRGDAACEMCGSRYTPSHDRQRTCGRACGELMARLNAA